MTTLTALTADQVSEWSEEVRVLGSPERERFVLVHASLVRHIAQRIMRGLPTSVEFQDLVSEGVVGLIEAIERFDPSRGVPFASFAISRIRWTILDALRARDMAPPFLRRQLREMDSAILRVETRLGHAPGDDQVAEELGVDTGSLSRLKRIRETLRPVSGDTRLDETRSASFHSQEPGPFDLVASAELLDLLANEIRDLPPREQMILGLYYEQELTMDEIGRVLGVTESRISQIHSRTVRELEQKFKAHVAVQD